MGHLKKFLCFLIQWPSWKYIFRTVLNNRSICKVWCFLSSEKLPFGSFPIGFLVRFFQQMCFVLNFDKISRLEGKAGLRFPRPRVNDSHSVPFNLDKMSGSRVIYESQLRNLGWPLRARFVRDKKLNRFLRTNGFVQRVIDRTGAKQGGRNFPPPLPPMEKPQKRVFERTPSKLLADLYTAICNKANNEQVGSLSANLLPFASTCKTASHFSSTLLDYT